MDTYVNIPKDSPLKIDDFKLFYVLSNNNTQLKCYEQLKTFELFAKMIINLTDT